MRRIASAFSLFSILFFASWIALQLPIVDGRAAIWDLSTTAGSNTTIEGISWAEGMEPGNVNNGVRAIAAMLAEWRLDLGGENTSAGTDTITLTTDGGITAYADGMMIGFTAGGTNTGAATFNVDAVGAQDLKKYTQAGLGALAANDIITGGRYIVSYETTNSDWILINPAPGTFYAAGGTDVALADGGTGASLVDPDADRIFFWDDSAGSTAFLTAGTGLAISTTTLSLSHLGLQSLSDPNADRIFFWDDSETASGFLSLGTAYAVSTTTLRNPLESFCVAASDETTSITTGTDKIHWRMPYAFTITGIRGHLTGPSTSGTFTADVHESGTTIMDTSKLVFDANEETTTTAATAPVVSDPALADDAEMSIDVDDDGTSAEGLKICFIGYQT